jgi:hypothetical protein
MQYRWWWWTVRELLKFAIVLTATELSIRAPVAQAMCTLLLVVTDTALEWQAQACGSVSMERMQFVAFCYLQVLAVLALLPTMPGVRDDVLGWCILALTALAAVQVGLVIASLAWRCMRAARKFMMNLNVALGSTPPLDELP